MTEIAIGVMAIAFVATLALTALAYRRLRQAGRRMQILDDIARVADGDRSLEQTLDAIADILVPEFGDFCTIDVIEGDRIRRATVRASGPDAERIEAGLAERTPALQKRLADAASLSRQEPHFLERVSEADLRDVAQSEEDLEFLHALGVRSSVTVELRARRKPTGMLTVGVSHSGRRYRPSDAHFAGVLAGRVALALDNAGLFSDLERSERERARIAETLQRGLLPPPLPHIPGWSVAAMYRPAGAENEIGGDFYDAFRIAGGWMVVVGDVTGRGAHAASVTAHARYTLRAAGTLTGDPVVSLETLNRALLARPGSALCSVAMLAIEEDPARPLRLVTAGHPAPLLVAGEAVAEVGEPGPVLGAFPDSRWTVEPVQVRREQQLVIVTDGITDSRGPEGRFGGRRLRDELAGLSSPALAALNLESALLRFTAGALDDDVAMLALGPASPRGATVEGEDGGDLIMRLFEAFNRRDAAAIEELCDDDLAFFPVGTAEAVGRTAPYAGPEGLRAYLEDVERVWEELLITPKVIERHGDSLLVRGRVYVRSRELGIRDMPAAWIWDVVGGHFVRGEVFTDPEQAVARVASG